MPCFPQSLEFQFLNGSINMLMFESQFVELRLFQFLNGSINMVGRKIVEVCEH